MFSRQPKNALEVKAGDLIAFSGDSFISDLVNIATYGFPRWGISHVGIMGEATDGRLLLFESTTLEGLPDEITGENFAGTQAHHLDPDVAAYRGKVWHYPLYRELYESERKRLADFLMKTIHVPYDQMVLCGLLAWDCRGSSRCFESKTFTVFFVANG